MPSISVLMPAFKQAHFIRRALESVKNQTLDDWELWVIDDASPDGTEEVVLPYRTDPRIHYLRFEQNRGMGAALNAGLERATGEVIAYLPADDVWYPEHLQSLLDVLQQNPSALAAFSGVRHHYNRSCPGQIEGYPLQMVQVAHRITNARWVERDELVTDDLDRMFWNKLRKPGASASADTSAPANGLASEGAGAFASTGQVTCEWVDHPGQRHKLLREPEGGINPYRLYTGAQQPLRFHTSVGNLIDEVAHYRRFRERPDTPLAAGGLKILLVGELAYNPERVLALEEAGHKLYGLWMQDPYWYNNIGPLPFGHVEDLSPQNWQEEVRRVQPDVIYALLNWQAVPFAHHVLKENPGVPFVWHFKEGPFICLEKGTWNQLEDLTRLSDGQIYSSPEMRDWYETSMPGVVRDGMPFVLDGDLPKKDWLSSQRSKRLSEDDGEIHTVVPGRPIGLHPHNVAELAEQGIHLHFYGDFTHGQWLGWIEKTKKMANGYIHLHSHVDQGNWVKEFSQYDAGWLHFFTSENQGDLTRANWDDLNYPARMATLSMAGLPMIQRDNQGAIVATQNLARRMDLSLFMPSIASMGDLLGNRERLRAVQESVWQQRHYFTFDYHVESLVEYFRQVIGNYSNNGNTKKFLACPASNHIGSGIQNNPANREEARR